MADLTFDQLRANLNASNPGASPTPPAAGPGAVPRTATPAGGMWSRMGAQMPTFAKGAGAVAKYLPDVGAGLAALGEGAGVWNAATDPTKTKLDVGTRAAEGVSRLSAMGAGAGLGLAGAGPWGAALGGTAGYFAPNLVYSLRDWMRGGSDAGAAPAASPAPARVPMGPSEGEGLYADQTATPRPLAPAGPGAVPPGMVRQTNGAIVTPDALMSGTGMPVSGMGAIKVGSNPAISVGAATAAPGPDAVAGFNAAPGSLASFYGAGMNQKHEAAQGANQLAYSKLYNELLMKSSGMAKDSAEAANINARTKAAEEHLKKAPGDYATAGAIAAGRSVPGDSYVFRPTMDAGKIDVGDTRTGAVQRVAPKPQINEVDIAKTMQANKMTREQVVARLKAEGKM